MELEGKVALITGGGEGIGFATAKLFAKEGAKVGVLGRTQKTIQKAVDTIKAAGGEAVPLLADISEPEQMRTAVEKLVATYGRLDIVFAHAGVNGVWAPVDELTPEEWDKTIKINLSGTYYTIHVSIPHLKKQGGSIIITSSVNGTRIFSNSGATAYSASKAGQIAVTKMLALELGPHKIRVNALCPGAIDTSIDQNTTERHLEKARMPVEFPKGEIPLTCGTPGKAEDCAEAVLFLASDRARHISGTLIYVDGAQSLLQG